MKHSKPSQNLAPLLMLALVGIVVSLSPATAFAQATFQGLGDLPGGDFLSQARAVSADGTVVVGVGSTTIGLESEAFLWTAGDGMMGLGFLPGGSTLQSVAFATSANGSVVVGRSTSASGQEAFRWTSAGGMVGLGDLPGGVFRSEGLASSVGGAVVVGRSISGSHFIEQAFIWTPDEGMRNIQDILVNDWGLDLTGWELLLDADAISADGMTIVGRGFSTNGIQEAWIATLPPSPVCGDGVAEGVEQCDDGAGNSDTTPDACRTDCTNPTCGDGVVDSGEQCDDTGESLTCDVDCTVVVCGDGTVNVSAGEECDDGSSNSDSTPDACRTDCTAPTCGDGVVDSGEECDDAGESPTCSVNCTVPFGDGTASFRGLGDLPGGDFLSQAGAVSADGQVVVGGSRVSTTGNEPFRWTFGGGMVGLGDVPNGNHNSFASATSADGTVVVGRSSAIFCPALPFRWTAAGGMVRLGALPGGTCSAVAHGTSEDGSVVVGQANSPNSASTHFEAFRWTSAGGMVGLGDLPGGIFGSSARAVSADGTVVVGSGRSDSGTEAFRWTSGGGMVGFGALLSENFFSSASATSADGSVVVGRSRISASGSVTEAFIWTAHEGMRSLRDLLVNDFGLDLAGWELADATGISADGVTIVGRGTNPEGFTEAWVAMVPDLCGDGVVDSGEECDDGAGNSDTTPDACRTNCRNPSCGDGAIDSGEQCDDAGESPACDVDCTVAECGDGAINDSAGEECDDAGESPMCDVDCTVAECGDGAINVSAGEECDDGNTGDGDGCSVTCAVENGSRCTGEPSVCVTGIPSVSQWGLVALALLILTAGTLVNRRCRPEQA